MPLRPETLDRLLPRAVVLATLLAAAVALSLNEADPDLWGHVQYGNDLLRDGLPATTTYSYTAEGFRWINHENLAEVLMAAAAACGGWALMTGKCLLGLLVTGLVMLAARRQGAGLLVCCGAALLVAANISQHWSIRPQILSFVCYAVMLHLLDHAFRGWSGRWLLDRRDSGQWHYSRTRLRRLWLAVPLFLFWGNAHGGFVAGLCIFSAYLGLRCLEAFRQKGVAANGLAARLLMMAGAAVLATMINPYGPRLHWWLLESLGRPRPEITEWHPPQLLTVGAAWLWALLGVFLLSLAFSRRERDFTQLVILTLTLWQALQHQRHIPFFAIAVGFWMPAHIQSWLQRWRLSDDRDHRQEMQGSPAVVRWAMTAGLLLTFALLGVRLQQRLSVVRVERREYPVSAVQYMADQRLGGNLVVTFSWAQYLIGAFGPESSQPQVKVGFDGRFRTCYPQQLVDMHFDFVLGDIGEHYRCRGENSPAFDGSRVLDYRQRPHGPAELVLINRRQPHSRLVMLRQREQWVLLYEDEIAELWGRSDQFDNPRSTQYVPPARRRTDKAPQRGAVPWPALPLRQGAHA